MGTATVRLENVNNCTKVADITENTSFSWVEVLACSNDEFCRSTIVIGGAEHRIAGAPHIRYRLGGWTARFAFYKKRRGLLVRSTFFRISSWAGHASWESRVRHSVLHGKCKQGHFPARVAFTSTCCVCTTTSVHTVSVLFVHPRVKQII